MENGMIHFEGVEGSLNRLKMDRARVDVRLVPFYTDQKF